MIRREEQIFMKGNLRFDKGIYNCGGLDGGGEKAMS